MLKKVVPTVALCSLLLVGCNNDEAVPSNNETPMGELNNGNRVITPSPDENTGNNGAGTTNGGMNEGTNGTNDMNGLNDDLNNGLNNGDNNDLNGNMDQSNMDERTFVDEPEVNGNKDK